MYGGRWGEGAKAIPIDSRAGRALPPPSAKATQTFFRVLRIELLSCSHTSRGVLRDWGLLTSPQVLSPRAKGPACRWLTEALISCSRRVDLAEMQTAGLTVSVTEF